MSIYDTIILSHKLLIMILNSLVIGLYFIYQVVLGHNFFIRVNDIDNLLDRLHYAFLLLIAFAIGVSFIPNLLSIADNLGEIVFVIGDVLLVF